MDELSKRYYINVGKVGTFTATGDIKTSPDNVDTIIQYLKDNNQNNLVIHFHGGLISESSGMEIAAKMVSIYEGADTHPITVVWETGFLETLKDNLNKISKTKLFGLLLKYVLKAVTREMNIPIGGKGPGEPLSDLEIVNELNSDREFVKVTRAIESSRHVLSTLDIDELEAEVTANVQADIGDDPELEELVNTEGAATEQLRDGVLGEPGQAGQKGLFSTLKAAAAIGKIAVRVIHRHVKDRDHGFYCTVVEEIFREVYLADFGTWTWDQMKFKAAAMFDSNQGRTGDGLHAGRYLLQKLADAQVTNPNLTVDLVGHSAGSIAICHLLAAADDIGGPKFRKIAFLAPAVTTDLFYSELVKHPDRFQQFRMFTMDDDYESADKLVPVLYPRSLLYFISGVLEIPDQKSALGDETLAGLDRHLRGAAPYNEDEDLNRVVDFVATPYHLVKSVTGDAAQEGFRSKSVHHGDFDDDPSTLDSLTKFIRHMKG